MPELPDLEYLVSRLDPALRGRRILGAELFDPLIPRVLVPGGFGELLAGESFASLRRHGPFLHFGLERHELVMHLMLAGRLRLGAEEAKKLPYEAFTIHLAGGEKLSYADEKHMGKVYLCPKGEFGAVPGFLGQGLDLTGPGFTKEAFLGLIAKKRCQARVFLMDQSALSAIGNAYADEILFEAGIHPKAGCASLDQAARERLYEAVRSVLAWGIAEVAKAGRPLEEKVRGHLRVRNRAGEPCPRCGATIRKAGVLGFDSFFCPICQPDRAGKGLDWAKLEGRAAPPRPEGQAGAAGAEPGPVAGDSDGRGSR